MLITLTLLWGFWSLFILFRVISWPPTDQWAITVHKKMAAMFVKLKKNAFAATQCKTSVNKMWLKLPQTISDSSNKCWIITLKKRNHKFGDTGWNLHFCQFNPHLCDNFDNINCRNGILTWFKKVAAIFL